MNFQVTTSYYAVIYLEIVSYIFNTFEIIIAEKYCKAFYWLFWYLLYIYQKSIVYIVDIIQQNM